MNVIGHDHPRAKFIMVERNSPLDRPCDYYSDFGPMQILRTFPCGIEIAIHPEEDLAIGAFSGRREQRWR